MVNFKLKVCNIRVSSGGGGGGGGGGSGPPKKEEKGGERERDVEPEGRNIICWGC